ncbi:MAG: sporulation initiation factor Spo0A C-terminal domain-containing protein [Anaerovoracaceae bacterium]
MYLLEDQDKIKTLDPEEVSLNAERVVKAIGIPVQLNGYLYLVKAVCLSVNDGEKSHALGKVLYEDVGEQFCCSGPNVEKCIRNAVKIAWQNDSEKILRFFEEDSSVPITRRPTNRQLISALTWKIRRDILSTLVAEK